MTDTIEYTTEHLKEVAATIKAQITDGVLMSLGARDFKYGAVAATPEAEKLPSLIFDATILPMTKSGARGTAARTMRVVVSHNAMDYYDIRVTYNQRGDRHGFQPPVVHYEADDIDGETIQRLMLSLDYDGKTVTNPRLI